MRVWLRGIVCAAAAFVLSTGAAQAAFSPARTYPVGGPFSGIGYGDFNGDGIIDVVVTQPTRNDVVVMLGRADGTLSPPLAPIPVGQDPVAVTSCITPYMFGLTGLAGTLWWPGELPTLSGGGRCDIAVSDAGSGDVAVLVSKGDGTFAAPRFIPVDGTPGAIVGDVLDDGAGGVVFAEPQKNRLGVIHFGYHQPPTGPTWTTVGSDPEALSVRPGTYAGLVDVADTGSGDVQELTPRTDPSTHATELDLGPSWNVGSSPIALSAGSFGIAVARRDSADVLLLGSQQGSLAQSSPTALASPPVALATVNSPGSTAYGDLAVLSQDGAVTLLHQSAQANGWPTFTQTPVPVPGHPTALIGQPIRPLLDYAGRAFGPSPALTDLVVLDGAGAAASVLLQSPRLIVTPNGPHDLELGRIAAGTTSTADVAVTNGGMTPARVDHVSMFDTPFLDWATAFTLSADHCSGHTVLPGASCTITVRFTPQRPGDFLHGMYIFGGPDPSSIIGVTRFQGSAYLHAAVAAPGVQSLTDTLRRGVRASAACSAACTLTVRAVLSSARGRRSQTLGIAHVRLERGGKTQLRIHTQNKTLTDARRARLTLASTAVATSDTANGSQHPVSYTLKSITVTLKSK